MSNTNFKSASKSIKGYKQSKLAKSEKADCVVRAIASAFNITYNQAHKFAKETYLRKDKQGTNTYQYHTKNDLLAQNQTLVLSKGYMSSIKKSELFTTYGKKKSKMTVGKFIEKFNKGTYILSVRSHTFTVKGGVVVGGNKEDSLKMRVIVQKAWNVELI